VRDATAAVRSLAFDLVAQTKKKRRRKHRGTQGGGIDTRGPRGRPRTREEAKARARAKRSSGKGRSKRPVDRRDIPPTWAGAFRKALLGAAVFFLLLWLLFSRSVGEAAGLAAVMLVLYVPLSYYVDRFFYLRRLRQLQAQRAAQRQERRGGRG
jgi:hypothetical protein